MRRLLIAASLLLTASPLVAAERTWGNAHGNGVGGDTFRVRHFRGGLARGGVSEHQELMAPGGPTRSLAVTALTDRGVVEMRQVRVRGGKTRTELHLTSQGLHRVVELERPGRPIFEILTGDDFGESAARLHGALGHLRRAVDVRIDERTVRLRPGLAPAEIETLLRGSE